MESIKVLCFGDSLTEGYSKWGMSMTPYANKLKKCLEVAWPSTRVAIDVNGRSGDLVVQGLFYKRVIRSCDGFCETVSKFLPGEKAKDDKYDWIVILGGTNDLGHGLQPDVIFTGLERIYKTALQHGARVLALTVPECAVVNKSLDQRRDNFNTLIKEYKEDRFYTLDLHNLMPYHSMSDEKIRDQIWDDGLHFTEDGYSLIGDHVASRLVQLVGEIQGQTK